MTIIIITMCILHRLHVDITYSPPLYHLWFLGQCVRSSQGS